MGKKISMEKDNSDKKWLSSLQMNYKRDKDNAIVLSFLTGALKDLLTESLYEELYNCSKRARKNVAVWKALEHRGECIVEEETQTVSSVCVNDDIVNLDKGFEEQDKSYFFSEFEPFPRQ